MEQPTRYSLRKLRALASDLLQDATTDPKSNVPDRSFELSFWVYPEAALTERWASANV